MGNIVLRPHAVLTNRQGPSKLIFYWLSLLLMQGSEDPKVLPSTMGFTQPLNATHTLHTQLLSNVGVGVHWPLPPGASNLMKE